MRAARAAGRLRLALVVAAAVLAGCKLPALPPPPGAAWRPLDGLKLGRIAFEPVAPAGAQAPGDVPVAQAARPGAAGAGLAPGSAPAPAGVAPPAGGAPGPVPARRGGGGSGGGQGARPASATPPPPVGFLAAEPGTWRVGPALVRPRAGLAAGEAGGRLFALEGEHRASHERLAADGSAWERLDTVPTNGSGEPLPGRLLGAVATAPGELLLVGGTIGAAIGMPVRYGAAGPELTFHEVEPVQAPAAGLVGERLLVAGGFRVDAAGAIEVATGGVRRLGEDGSDDPGAAPPEPVAAAAGAVVGGRFYLLGGFQLVAGEARPVKRVQAYDPVLDRWRRDGADPDQPAALPIPLAFAAAAVLDGRIYLAGGRNDTGQPSPRAWCYDPPTRRWQELPPMPTGRAMLGLAAHAGRLWAIGGIGEDGEPCTTVEVFTP